MQIMQYIVCILTASTAMDTKSSEQTGVVNSDAQQPMPQPVSVCLQLIYMLTVSVVLHRLTLSTCIRRCWKNLVKSPSTRSDLFVPSVYGSYSFTVSGPGSQELSAFISSQSILVTWAISSLTRHFCSVRHMSSHYHDFLGCKMCALQIPLYAHM